MPRANLSKKQSSIHSSKRPIDEHNNPNPRVQSTAGPRHVRISKDENWLDLFISSLTLILASELSGVASQLSLSPIFGGIPSNLYHETARTSITVSALFLAFLPDDLLSSHGSKLHDFVTRQSTVLALHTPFLLPWLWKATENVGPIYGPVMVEGASFYLLRWMLLCRVALKSKELARLSGWNHVIVLAALSSIALFGIRFAIEAFLVPAIGSAWPLSRHGLQYCVAILVGLNGSWSHILPCIPGFLFPLWFSAASPLRGIEVANTHNKYWNHTLLARQDSVTGHVSILENNKLGYRVMRCDHSLLGGEWLREPAPGGLREPIYAAFVLLEAVRLVEPHARDREHASALIIGLGIGTSATGMIQHGIDTTIVELDPVVYRYAKDYFALPTNHTAHVTDAIEFIHKEGTKLNKGRNVKTYDYILHDVFTGGAVPAALFTQEFLEETKMILAKQGVIAINYAGDLNFKPARSIVQTILTVFTYCRAFRDSPRDDAHETIDFVNMVIFCTPFHGYPPNFLPAVDDDYHKTYIRKQYMEPKYEVDLDMLLKTKDKPDIITRKTVGLLANWQKESAIGHWAIMNKVVPPAVWRNY